MDRMKIIKRRLSMSLRSARPVDENLSELTEHAASDEPSASRENGEETRLTECLCSVSVHSVYGNHVMMIISCYVHTLLLSILFAHSLKTSFTVNREEKG